MSAPVSVIIPCYRCTETIVRAVTSVARQTLPPMELLLIEDGSEDAGKTLASLHGLQRQYRETIEIKVIALEGNCGPASARNAGWNIATQPYVAFLDADDEWHPEKLRIQYAYMQENPDVAVTGHLHVLLPDGAPTSLPAAEATVRRITPSSLLFRNAFATSSVMLKSNIPFRFPDAKRHAEDLFLWQQIALAGLPVVRLEVSLVHYFKAMYGSGGLSAQLWNMERGELKNLMALHRSGHIGLPLLTAATAFSLAKYLKRLLSNSWIRSQAHGH